MANDVLIPSNDVLAIAIAKACQFANANTMTSDALESEIMSLDKAAFTSKLENGFANLPMGEASASMKAVLTAMIEEYRNDDTLLAVTTDDANSDPEYYNLNAAFARIYAEQNPTPENVNTNVFDTDGEPLEAVEAELDFVVNIKKGLTYYKGDTVDGISLCKVVSMRFGKHDASTSAASYFWVTLELKTPAGDIVPRRWANSFFKGMAQDTDPIWKAIVAANSSASGAVSADALAIRQAILSGSAVKDMSIPMKGLFGIGKFLNEFAMKSMYYRNDDKAAAWMAKADEDENFKYLKNPMGALLCYHSDDAELQPVIGSFQYDGVKPNSELNAKFAEEATACDIIKAASLKAKNAREKRGKLNAEMVAKGIDIKDSTAVLAELEVMKAMDEIS